MWIPEEVDSLLHGPPCSGDTVQRKNAFKKNQTRYNAAKGALKNGRSGRNIARNRKTAMALRTETLRSKYIHLRSERISGSIIGKTNCQIFLQDAENEGLDIVEGLAHSEKEKKVRTRSERRKCRSTGQSRQYCPINREKRMMMNKLDHYYATIQ